MEEKIILPLDGSKVGEAALPYIEGLVAKLAPQVEVEVTLIQVLSSLSHYILAGEATARIPFTEQEIEQMRNRASRYLDSAGAVLRKNGAQTKVQVSFGDPADEIIKAADEINADMIAMSSHGRSGLSRWAFGSVTDRVVRGGNRPVLVVKAPKEMLKAG